MFPNIDFIFCTKKNEVSEVNHWVGKYFYRKEAHIPW